jgi:WD40 repeat protein/DNA-binding SARP family transcriptional activator
LGPVEVDGGSSLEPRDRGVLAVLTVRRGLVVTAAEIADALWGESPPVSWPKQVQICIGRIRRVVGAAAIETTGGGYRLTLPDDEIDVSRFELLVERGRSLTASGEPDRAAATFARALGLWRGPPLETLDGWVPARSEAARLEELRRGAEEDWLEARLAAGEHREVAAVAEAMVAAEPLRERRWASLALAQYRCARQGDALRSLAGARRVLLDQLGVSPGSALTELEAAILRQDPGLDDIAEPVTASSACPYRGLAPFDEVDAESFFGRDEEIAACLDRLCTHPFLVVAGPSGCGKSSLVRAGVVPALRRRGRDVIVVVPGSDPEGAVAAVRTARDVVVVDQFEELFALGHDAAAIDSVCEQLLSHADGRGSVILTIRSDRLGDFSGDPRLNRLVERSLHLVSPLTGDALRQAVEQPAAVAGLRLEHGLVELLVRDSDGAPGALPLLSHALVETWRRRDGATLTVEGYRDSGGIHAAVARSADRLHDGLSVPERATLRSVLLRLVAPSPEGDPVRCRVPSRTLLGEPGRERVVGMLVRARLVTAEEGSFEIAHEALARAWPRLRSWLDEDVAGQLVLRHLNAAADGWDTLGRPDTELYRGARLETALEWREHTNPQLTELEQTFLDTSEDCDRSERRALEVRALKDARAKRRLRVLLVISSVLVVAAVVAGMVAVRQADQTGKQRQRADVRELAATALADVDVDPERSALLALAALERAGSDIDAVRRDIERALHEAVTNMRIERRLAGTGRAVDWTADGRGVLTVGRPTGDVTRWDVTGGRPAMIYQADASEALDSPDGTIVAATSRVGTLRLLDAGSGDERNVVSGDGRALSPSFTADGRRLAASWPDERGGLARVVDAETGRVVEEFAWPGAHAVSISPDGTRLAVVSSSSGTILDLGSGRQVAPLEAGLGPLTDVAWSPDGQLIAIGRATGGAQVHDATTGQQRIVLAGHRGWVGAIAWSPDSTLLATASDDGTTKVWALVEGGGRELMTLTADDARSGFRDVAFSPDGTRIATGTSGGTAIVWRAGIDATAEVATLPGAAFGYGAAQFTYDGRRLLATSGEGNVAVWDVATWRRERVLGADRAPGPQGVFGLLPASSSDPVGIAPSPDSQLVATIADDQFFGADPVLPVYDIDDGGRRFEVDLGGWIGHMYWTSEGQQLAVTGGDRDGISVVRIVDREGRTQSTLRFPQRSIESARFAYDDEHIIIAHSPEGPYVPGAGRVEVWNWRKGERINAIEVDAWYAVPSPTQPLVAIGPRDEASDQTVAIWDYETGRRTATLAGHTGVINGLTFSFDGTRLATGHGDGSIRVWDARTGRQQLELRGHHGLVATVSISPEGRWLASYGAEGTIRVWALDLDELADIARQRVTRSLTDAECQRYLRETACSDD